MILRGGRGKPNYDRPSVGDALSQLRDAGLPEHVVIDASHDNSGKDHKHQPNVVAEIADQVASGSDAIVGVMLESFLVAGRQDLVRDAEVVYGQSITDACMDWETHGPRARPAGGRGARAARWQLIRPTRDAAPA